MYSTNIKQTNIQNVPMKYESNAYETDYYHICMQRYVVEI